MLNNLENEKGYEDSYQKRDRLEKEFEAVVDDLKRFFDAFKNDATAAGDSFRRTKENFAKFKELEEQDKALEKIIKEKNEKLRELNKSEIDIDEKIEAGSRLQEETCLLRDQERENSLAIDNLFQEGDALNEERVGILGDSGGAVEIIHQKFERIKELRKQINELSGDPDF
jgi:hypothetical protein